MRLDLELSDQEHVEAVAYFVTDATHMKYLAQPYFDDGGMGLEDARTGDVIAHGVDRQSFNDAYTESLHAENGADCPF